MYSMLDAHFLSVVIVVGSIMVTPIYVMAVYVFSGASATKGFQIGGAFLIWGAVMFWVCLSQILFPTGMIPLFLVTYAIFFHVLSWLNYLKFQRPSGKEAF